MIYKLFILLLAVNLFAGIANAEATENRYVMNSAGDDEILIEKEVRHHEGVIKVIGMLGAHWLSSSDEFREMLGADVSSVSVETPRSFYHVISRAKYDMNFDDEQISIAMNLEF